MKRMVYTLWAIGVCVMVWHGAALSQGMEKTSAKLYLKQEEYEKAVEWAQNAIAKDPQDAESHFLLGKAYAFTGNLKGMAEEFEKFEQLDTKNKKKNEREEAQNLKRHHFSQSFNQGVEAFNQHDFDLAADKFSTAKMLDKTQAGAYQNLAVAYRQLDFQIVNQECAVDCDTTTTSWNAEMQQCEDSGTGEKTSLCCCGAAAQGFLFDSIVSTYKELIAMEPDSLSNYLALSDFYEMKQKYQESTALLETAAERFSNNGKIYSELAIAYDFMGETEKAFETYEKAIAQDPGNKDLRFNYGRLFLMKEDYVSAIDQFQKVLAITPEDFEANYNVGVGYLKIGETADKMAMTMEEEAAEKNKTPNTTSIDSLRTVAKEKFAASVPFLEKASELQPEQSAVWYNLAVGYTRTGESEKAKAAFAKSEALASEN